MASEKISLPYHEPNITTILILTSFLLLSNLLNWALDKILFCGLIGQILIGVAWGTPGGRWLNEDFEKTVVQFGYLGLILIVYEGGLSTSFRSLKANILFSAAVAITGICVPIGLSFTLRGFAHATSLQSFAAGAALCSTSLGTTFTVLGTTGLLKTRLGVVLTSAAMLDDVVGLIMVQVISNIGNSASDPSVITVLRPIFVSIAFAVICPLLCWLVLRPVTLKLNKLREQERDRLLNRALCRVEAAFCLHTTLLISMVIISSYAGTSNLFAAYLAGAMISWWDTEVPHFTPSARQVSQEQVTNSLEVSNEDSPSGRGELENLQSGMAVYENYYSSVNNRILKLFFFTSIGFSIPITRLFSGPIVWRGVIYGTLMLIAKLLCGLWLVRFSSPLPRLRWPRKIITETKSRCFAKLRGRRTASEGKTESPSNAQEIDQNTSIAPPDPPQDPGNQQDRTAPTETSTALMTTPPLTPIEGTPSPPPHPPPPPPPNPTSTPAAPLPFSLYPSAILGLAMVARGEIGFLISSVAESNGVFSTTTTTTGDDNDGHDDDDDRIFLIVTWAIVLCTVVGPVGMGLLVRRVRRLEMVREGGNASGRDVLGVWGVG